MNNQILLVNGPNINLLGKREPSLYGLKTLLDIENDLKNKAQQSNYKLKSFQSNSEGEICTYIQNNIDSCGIIINAAAYTHTSIAILDSLKAVKSINSNVVIVEVHLSNIHQREEFRHKSYISHVANAVIMGMKSEGYEYALDFILKQNGKQ